MKYLSWTIGTANRKLASRLWDSQENDPKSTAEHLEATHPDYYDTVSWYFGSVQKFSPSWVESVGRALNVDRMLDQLENVSVGNAASVFLAWEILGKLRIPYRRSMVRRIAKAFGKSLTNCPLKLVYIGAPPFSDPTWLVFNDEIEHALKALDRSWLAVQLTTASPREWRRFADLTMFAIPAVANLEKEIVNQLDVSVFADRVARNAEGHEYELWCLLWSFGRASASVKEKMAQAIYETVADACRRSASERAQRLKAFYSLGSRSAEKLCAELNSSGVAGWVHVECEEERLNAENAKVRWTDAVHLAEKYSQLEESVEEYVFDPWDTHETKDSATN